MHINAKKNGIVRKSSFFLYAVAVDFYKVGLKKQCCKTKLVLGRIFPKM